MSSDERPSRELVFMIPTEGKTEDELADEILAAVQRATNSSESEE